MNIEYVELKQCPYCNSKKISKYKKRLDDLWVMICDDCNLGFVEKYPKDLSVFYGDEYYKSTTPEIGYENYQKIKYEYFIWAVSLVALTGSKGTLFDIGASSGLFLDLAKISGFDDVCGVEFNVNCANICRRKGYDVYGGSFLDENYNPDKNFHVVTAWAVFEHIPELREMLERIKNLLKDDGILFFEIPCLTFKEENDGPWFNSSLEHIYYFTEKSFKEIILHHFGNEYIGRVVDVKGFGSTVIGFVSTNKEKTKRLRHIGEYLKEIKDEDLEKIGSDDLIKYMCIYLRYISDVKTAKRIASHLENCRIREDASLSDYIISFLVMNYSIIYSDNMQYLDSKHFFLEEIEKYQKKLVETEVKLEAALEREGRNLEELQNQKIRFQETENKLEEVCLELNNIYNSRTYRLAVLFRNARQSNKQFLLFPLRFVWFFSLERAKNKIRSLYQKIRLRKIKKIKNRRWNRRWLKHKPLVSIIIPCFNYGKYIEEAVDSVLNQTFKDFEIMVVDGGSDDGETIDVLKQLNKPKTRLFFRKGRHLVGSNRNYGIERSKGKYICCLDPDDILRPTYLEKALFLAETYYYDLIYPSVQCFGGSDQLWQTCDVDFNTCIETNGISTVALFKKKAWKKVGGYKDLSIDGHYVHEDWEFWVRVLGNGFRSKNIREPLMFYRVHNKGLCAINKHPYEWHKEKIKEANRKLLRPKNIKKISKKTGYKYDVVSRHINLAIDSVSEKNNILFALPFMIIGGADTILFQVGHCLKENKYNLSYVTTVPTEPSLGDNTWKFEEVSNEIYHLPRFLSDHSQWKEFILYVIKTKKIDMLFLVGSEFVYEMLPEIKQRFPKIKVVDQLFNEFGHIDNNRKYCEFIDVSITANNKIANILKEKYYEKDQKIKVIIHGVDTHIEFNPSNIEDKTSYKSLDLYEGRFIASFFGRFSEEKQPAFFVDIAIALSEMNIQFVMVGNGPEYDSVKKKIVEHNMNHKIYAPGFIDDIRPFMKRSDVVLIPSMIEGIPIVLLESLSMGVPVIASNVGGIPDIIQNGYNGFICESDNVHSFVEKIKLLYSQPEIKNEMSLNARRYAEQNLDVSYMKHDYLQVIRDLSSAEAVY